jgi:hypothetical protein
MYRQKTCAGKAMFAPFVPAGVLLRTKERMSVVFNSYFIQIRPKLSCVVPYDVVNVVVLYLESSDSQNIISFDLTGRHLDEYP